MSYINLEQSTDLGRPSFGYEFIRGSEEFRFSSLEQDVQYNGHTWLGSSISHSAISQTEDLSKNNIQIKFPVTDPFAVQYAGDTISDVTTLTIYRAQSTDAEAFVAVIWKGRIAGCNASDKIISINCESIFTSLRRPGLRATFQKTCRHSLYGRGCNLDMELFASVGSCTSIAGNVVNVSGAANLGTAGYYTGGIIKAADGVMRTISNHSGNALTLLRPIFGLTAGQAITLYPGCSHVMSACNEKFNNLDNFGGFPWIPSKNPMGGSSIV